jgi:putative peptide zinc metalloprotease protein
MAKPVASVERPLALRLRPDLLAARVEMSGTQTWVVKDPVTLEHFQFSAEEYALMEWLRQRMSIAELQRRYAREFPPQTISPQAVWDFLSRLHEAGLLVSDGAGQGRELLARRRRERSRNWAMSWARLLAIRFRGIDPDSFIQALHERCRWLFSRAALLLVAALILYAASLLVGHFEEFRNRLPELNALVDVRNLPWLLVAISIVKVLHELGHAVACKHFGGEVRELGLMLLVFTPCLYCDVSDAWRLASKWQRIMISAAGMMTELVLAAIATIVWWHAQPGVLQLVALNIVLVSTVGTIFVNGNPLLRYDGYYILSDLAETPNLWQRSRDVLRRMAGSLLMRRSTADDSLVPASQRPWLALYALASKLYIGFVLVAIVWGLVQVLYPYRLQNLAYAVGLIVLGIALAGPVSGALHLARNPLRRQELRTGRVTFVLAVTLAAGFLLLSLPVNYYVKGPVVLMPEEAARVYATMGGRLMEAIPAGRRVERGEAITSLVNSDTDLELARLEGEHQLRRLRVEHLERLRGIDREANDHLPTARAALADSARRLEEARREAARLTLTAPVDGAVIAAPRHNRVADAHGTRLATWTGSLDDESNRGAHVEAGTLVCLVGDPARLAAVLLVGDTDAKRLEPGQHARLRLEQLPGVVVEGKVVEVSRHDARAAEDAEHGSNDLDPLYAGLMAPGRSGALYKALVRFDAPLPSLVFGGRGEAKVAAERITLARRIVRYMAHTFRLPM